MNAVPRMQLARVLCPRVGRILRGAILVLTPGAAGAAASPHDPKPPGSLAVPG